MPCVRLTRWNLCSGCRTSAAWKSGRRTGDPWPRGHSSAWGLPAGGPHLQQRTPHYRHHHRLRCSSTLGMPWCHRRCFFHLVQGWCSCQQPRLPSLARAARHRRQTLPPSSAISVSSPTLLYGRLLRLCTTATITDAASAAAVPVAY